ncbi:hypothetical protein [Microbacterium candidum]|uniref:DUF4254 domain-containing protein n=1 Tax=Microbacterium candidum TaxID=3041922 RepID=A0ABT7MW26_9MICO|nr:hypothetical protein [Microbacterium sp. ASV49]MDL9978644.1 hypothetical protein [Microbacterium sp. ASV49]
MSTLTTPRPAHVQAMSTRLVGPIRYPLAVRLYDSWWIGRRDADPQLAHTPARGEQPSASLRALDAVRGERCEREWMSAELRAASLIDRRTGLTRMAEALRAQIDEWTTQIEEQGAVSPEDLAHVPKTEAHLDPAQRTARRQREAAARVAPLVSVRDAARRELAGIPRELADIDGKLTTLFDSLRARVTAITHYYERRCNTLIRGYLRRAPGDADHPLNTRIPLRRPAWADAPNPWVPTAATPTINEEPEK